MPSQRSVKILLGCCGNGELSRYVNVCLQGKKKRDFVQSFFLAVQEKGYFVLNDTFRYLSDRALGRPSQYSKENGYLQADYAKQYSQASSQLANSLLWRKV